MSMLRNTWKAGRIHGRYILVQHQVLFSQKLKEKEDIKLQAQKELSS